MCRNCTGMEFFIGSWLEVTVENVSSHHEVGVCNECKNKQSLKGLQEKQLLLKATSDVFEDTGVFFPMEQSEAWGGREAEGRKTLDKGGKNKNSAVVRVQERTDN